MLHYPRLKRGLMMENMIYIKINPSTGKGGTMKRYFILAGVDHEGKDGRYAIANNCFDVHADDDGLWLTTPESDGAERINLCDDNAGGKIDGLWRRLNHNQKQDENKEAP